MPLHQIYHPVDAYSDKDKIEIAERITKMYTSIGLPPFYVVVLFHAVPSSSFYVGGRQTNKFIRVHTQHLARAFNGDSERKRKSMEYLDVALKPYTQDRGYDWETHVTEVDRELWRENGLVPPLPGTEAEKVWVKENRAVPYSKL
ncbi:hypothetical protein SmJEL517_g06199 [Synchytrium microbalum]|uniref:Tautomerase cis-CaaD-like domain-containing protein n=1 Tax=Synchytrium microbalum TaxID=1806994 RepID=A0A507BJM6_9FUNG|nr:uncharacterized protein SmJEL517_g06199 [Synchytrium microbalum]TPX30177.1 hypothetical protein SmJEL517_g06199 [Synchytrium microbalum]